MKKHAPNCLHCVEWVAYAEKLAEKGRAPARCIICGGWGWTIGCPFCKKQWR